MTPDERNMLADLATKIAQTPAPPRDAEAEDFIRKNIGSRPDALYLMTQTVLIQNMALQQSQHQIQELQQRLSQPVPAGPSGGGSGGFLSHSSAPPAQYAQQPQYQAAPPQYGAPPPQYGAPQYAAPPVQAPSATSGFLRNAAQTAAGVAAGTLAVQGIESLFSHHSGFGGGEGFFGGGGGGMFGGGGVGGYAPGETIIENNYYGDPQQESRGGEHFANTSDDANTVDDDTQLQDASYDDTNTDDNSSYDDSSTNDV